MSRNTFTEEEMERLRQNPYTYRVTKYQLSFTKEFKEIFYSEYQAGELPRQILIDHGYDPAILGDRRVWGIYRHLREQYEKYGGFRESGPPHRTQSHASAAVEISAAEENELKKLRHEVDYLKQEIEFLKKISSIRTTRK